MSKTDYPPRNECQTLKLFISKLFQTETLQWYLFLTPETHLEPSQTSKVELFSQNSKKAPS